MSGIKISLLFSILLFSIPLFGNKINGLVKDSSTGEWLIGAHVHLVSVNGETTYRTVSELDGSYTFNKVNVGEYELSVSYIGYQNYTERLVVNTSTTLDIELHQLSNELDVVVVRADNSGTDSQARMLERQSANVVNIISSKQIQLSPDLTVANVIQRVSGLSIERNGSGDPQYAIVRGMDKRYNNTLVNGIKIPSPDNENRYVPLDIFPAVFLERLEVYKSLTANMEADAIGGTVNMVMKSAPLNETIEADVQIGYNEMNFSRDFLTYDRSNLNRKSPKELHGARYRATPEDFPIENMTSKVTQPLPDVLANITYGNRFIQKKLGVMVGLSFQNSYRPVSNYFYDPSVSHREGNPLNMQQLIDRETSSQLQRIAVHGKLDYEINKKNALNLYVGKYYLNEFKVREQLRRESFVIDNNYAVYPITRFSNIFQDITIVDLGGKHQFSPLFDVSWHTVYSIASNDRPDDGVFSRAGQYDVIQQEVNNEIVYFQGTRNSRAWERNKDQDISAYVDFKYLPNIINEKTVFQFGAVARNKVRDNYYNYYNYSQIFGQFRGEDWYEFGDVDFISMANPLGSGDRSNLIYDATERILAAYVNTKWQINGAELQAGLRLENTEQSYEINELSASSNEVNLSKTIPYTHLFPSASFKQAINDKSYLKATYFKGISRPGFYEIVPTVRSNGGGDSFYSERGNPDLKPSIGHSLDLRYEYFPSHVDQILFGVFYKRIIDPIEYGFPQVVSADEMAVANRILPQNFDEATNYGIEADFTKYFGKFGLRLNYTYTNSTITTNKIVINEDRSQSIVNQSRPLQGQSNHIGNISFLYKNQVKKLDMQVVFNYTGERIAFVSPFFEADHYMRPMTQLDFSIEKGFGERWVVFAKANNLLDTPYRLYVKKPLANPEDPYPHQTDPFNIANVRQDLYGRSYRLGVRYSLK